MGVTPVERGRVEATASLADWLARAAAERNNGEIRTVVARIRRMKYLLGVDSNHHDHRTRTI
jgi:predicted nuclease with TOPRIM domain